MKPRFVYFVTGCFVYPIITRTMPERDVAAALPLDEGSETNKTSTQNELFSIVSLTDISGLHL